MYWSAPSGRSRFSRSTRYRSRSASGSKFRSSVVVSIPVNASETDDSGRNPASLSVGAYRRDGIGRSGATGGDGGGRQRDEDGNDGEDRDRVPWRPVHRGYPRGSGDSRDEVGREEGTKR